MYTTAYYAVVSYVLFLIALTFPVNASPTTCDMYNTWFELLFLLLPIDYQFQTLFAQLKYSAKKNPFRNRVEFVNLVFVLHEMILKQKLDRQKTLFFFDLLRANECSANPDATEKGCKRIEQTLENACFIYIRSSKKEETSCFVIDPELLENKHLDEIATNEQLIDIETKSMTSQSSFCSCLFSAKWFLLHMIASAYPYNNSVENMQLNYHLWLTLFGNMLACTACRDNFRKNLVAVKYNPEMDLKSRASAEWFFYNLHFCVNRMLHQKNIEFIDMQRMFSKFATIDTSYTCNVVIAPKRNHEQRFILEE